jgi:predicted membrane-bound spermidine synthase
LKRKSRKFLNKYSTLLQISDVEYSLIPVSAQALQSIVFAITTSHSIKLSFLYVVLFFTGALVGMGLPTIVACQRARHYFWQFVFGDNSLSPPVDWWHNCILMS